jgi:hypothetical protein
MGPWPPARPTQRQALNLSEVKVEGRCAWLPENARPQTTMQLRAQTRETQYEYA